MNHLPLFAQLKGRACLLVGAGTVASRKLTLLRRAGARVTVVAPEADADIRQLATAGEITWLEAPFRIEHLDEHWLVVAATADAQVNAAVAEAAESRRMLCNVVDDPERCSFIMPAIIDRNPVTVAISSSGTAPVLARRIKHQIEQLLPARLGDLAVWADSWRSRITEAFTDGDQRRRAWEEILNGPLADDVLDGQEAEASERLSEWLANNAADPGAGEAWLVGAGPGDPDLITVRGARLLHRAEVVLYDRLITPELLELARRDAEVIAVGKAPGGAGMKQDDINALLVQKVQEGKRVCRLKGGDPFVFGRGGEELEALTAAGLRWRVVPGVTAASGCAAYTGIPLTHRHISQSLVIVTAHADIDLNWDLLARPGQTLAFYMGVRRAGKVADELIGHGADPDTPFVVVENGTTSDQRVVTGTLTNLGARVEEADIGYPALILIGGATARGAMHEHNEQPRTARTGWLKEADTKN